MGNIYFELTREFNAEGRAVVLASGQAVVYYRLAIMSKDGDWIVRESDAACRRILAVLAAHGARYRPSAPLDPRWLAGGWSSHFEFVDPQRHRIRCDFFSRPPRIREDDIERLFTQESVDDLPVVGIEPLILMKQTQRAKDYAVIGELARLLPPEREVELTTDVDRLLELAPAQPRSQRPAAVAAARGDRDATVVALAREADALRRTDAERLARYEAAADAYARAFRRDGVGEMPLRDAHERACRLAAELLPVEPSVEAG
jgi:hypothetical protein